MTRDEFQHKYHDYRTDIPEAAACEALKVNEEAEGFLVTPLQLPLGCCLVLDTPEGLGLMEALGGHVPEVWKVMKALRAAQSA